MRLQIETRIFNGREVYVLCDQDGVELPCQRDVVINQPLDEVPTVTITFLIDGYQVSIKSARSE